MIVIALAFFLAMRSPIDISAPEFIDESRKIPMLEFVDKAGATIRLADFRGTPLVINAWATWCPFCLKELQDFAAVQKEFEDKVKIIAINRAESSATVIAYSAERGTMQDELLFLLDREDAWYREIGGFSMPETIFVDAGGVIKGHVRGPMAREEMRRRIQDLITTTIQ